MLFFPVIVLLAMSALLNPIHQHLNRALLAEIHSYWLKGVPETHDVALPSEALQRWFYSNPQVDEHCR